MKIVTILLDKPDQGKIKDKVARVLEPYDSFVLVEASEEQIAALRREGFKVTVREELNTIRIGEVTVNTREARYNEQGSILPHAAYVHTRDPGPEPHHYIVQFIGPVKEEWKQEIRKRGGLLCDPLPSYAYIMEMDVHRRNEVIKLPFVRWVGHYDPAYRLSSGLLQEVEESQKVRSLRAAQATPEETRGWNLPPFPGGAQAVPNTFSVSFHTAQNLNDALPKIRALGTTVVATSTAGDMLTVSFPEDTPQVADKLRQLAGIHGVRTIDAIRIRRPYNNIATRLMAGLPIAANLNLPLTGEGEVVAVADTGLDTGDPNTLHEDFRGRTVDIKSWPISPAFDDYIRNAGGDDGPADVDSGHGTHVAGSVLGSGARARAPAQDAIPAGLAHDARLLFQAIEQKLDWKNPIFKWLYGEYLLAGLPDDLTKLFRQAYEGGARIHTNSWGGGKFGAYDEHSRAVDRFVWEHRDMVVLFAAGNAGEDKDADGKINAGSITPPATAKNCIAVGAAENVREEFADTYGDGWHENFPAEPITSDMMADDPDDVAAFSSRGPSRDNRFKPDVVAPGTWILSTKSSLARGDGWQGYDEFYTFMGGTSMATPLTAGAVALIREYLRKRKRRYASSAALVKAALIHTAASRPYRYAGTSGPSRPWDSEQGWGHVSLRPFVTDIPGWTMKFIDVRRGLRTGQKRVYRFTVAGSGHPLKVTLVWTDFPGGVDQDPSLVNNLNLIVTVPDGADYHGNVFTAPFNSTLDTTNNVETVIIANPQPGQYAVTVLGSDVREGPQGFALVYSGELS